MLRFVQSTQSLWFGQGPNKLSRWFNLFRLSLRPSRRVLGFDVQCVSPQLLLHLYHEVFAKDEYLFSCDTESPVILDCGANIGMAGSTFFDYRFALLAGYWDSTCSASALSFYFIC